MAIRRKQEFQIKNSVIRLFGLLCLVSGCSESTDTNFDRSEVREIELDTTHFGWPSGNPGVKYGFAPNGELKYQILRSPVGDTVHFVEYEKGKIMSDMGLYFYTTTERLTEVSDSISRFRFYHNVVIPDTNLVANFCLFEYSEDSAKYIQKGQYYIGKNRVTLDVEFLKVEPIIYWCIFLVNKDEQRTKYKYLCHDPLRLPANVLAPSKEAFASAGR